MAGRLVWNECCSLNLAAYLPRLFEKPGNLRGDWTPPRVAIVAKSCDARSVVGLVKEHQLGRENVIIIGMPCQGMVDPEKADASGDGRIAQACLECARPSPVGADILIEGPSRPAAAEHFQRVKDFEALTPAQRWDAFVKEISKCTRCYACRQACPNCYCKSCFIEQSKPSWAGVGDDLADLLLFHIGRMFHQAGRCVECDACVRACPMGIDLRLFTQKLVKDVEELFGYVPGISLDDLPPLCTFLPDDSECFTTGPGEE